MRYVKIRHTTNNNFDNALHDDASDNLEDKLRLDGELHNRKMSI